MLQVVYNAILYFGIPIIILGILFLSIYLAVAAPRESRLSAMSGLFAGLVAFTIYLVGSFSGASLPESGLSRPPSFDWLSLIIGCAIGLAIPICAQYFKAIRSGLVGLSTLFLSATSSTAAFSYFFASPLRDATIFLALGSLFGMLVYLILSPGAIRDELLHRRSG